MGVLTTFLKLLKPGENDYYNQQTEQADNWQKVDDYAVLTNADKNAVWGGLDGGGLIEDPTVVKEVGERYIGADGKAYICLKPSNINNSENYTPCNVVDNLDKLQNLIDIKFKDGWIIKKYDNGFKEFIYKTISPVPDKTKIIFPEKFTKIETIMWQVTEGTNVAADTSSVSSVGIGDVTLESAVFRFYRPDSAPNGDENACFLLCGF